MPTQKIPCSNAVQADVDREVKRPPSVALEAVASIVAPTSADAAAVIAAVLETIATSGADPGDIDVTAAALRSWRGLEPEQADHRLREADRLFREHFEVGLLSRAKDRERPESHGSRASRDRPWFASDASANGSVADIDEATPESLRLSTELGEILRQPLPVSTRSTPPVLLDAVTRRWCATIEVLSRSSQGAHLALRRGHAISRELDDLTAYLRGSGLMVRRLTCRSDRLAFNLLRAELHDANAPIVVIVEGNYLAVSVEDGDDDAFGWEGPPAAAGELVPTAFSLAPPPWLARARHVYLWTIPETGVVPANLVPFIGGCLGPVAYDPNWSRALVAAALDPGGDAPVSAGAVRALSSRLADPRDAGAMATIALAMAEAGAYPVDQSCSVVASSFADARPPEPAVAEDFDPRLLVCDEEALLVLARADAVAESGGRILAWGPPGGGKTTYARALAQAMADGRYVRHVSPGDFLARAWGATERLTRALWRRAADKGEILVIDEFEVVCGAREPGSGNAYLTRTLTDEWIRAMDDHPRVPLLATCNDVAAVDGAARRRFSCTVHFSDRLSPAQERLAWDVVLAIQPPPGWQPVGASVADMAQARARCRMLGLVEAASMAQAVRRAMEARLGPGRRPNLPALGGKAIH